MWRIPYTSWFGLVCAVLVFFVMWVACRLVTRAIRTRSDEKLAQQTRIALELHDTMLQTVQGSKLVTDAALEKSNDPVHMRLALEKLSVWLGQASQEGQESLNSLRSSTTETQSKSKIL